jgi:hypothetical protein
LLGESKDLGQCTNNNDLTLATLLAGVDFDSIDERTDDFDSLRACRVISQQLLQSGDLSAVEVWKIRMKCDLHVAFLGLQVGADLAFANLQTP